MYTFIRLYRFFENRIKLKTAHCFIKLSILSLYFTDTDKYKQHKTCIACKLSAFYFGFMLFALGI